MSKKSLITVALSMPLVGSLLLPQTSVVASISEKETMFSIMDTQVNPTWGLDRIDGALDNKYTYPSGGAGVTIYVVDTGVDASHPDLTGRVLDGFDAFGENLDQKDCQGHGTHVAGVIAGEKYGVAKDSTIVPVRVLNCSGQGNTTTLTSGIDWILGNHSGSSPAVVNMSLGGNKDLAVNAAVSRLTKAGLIVTVAAGNFSADACNYSPASADGVIAVGAVGIDDSRSSFSNWGTCVDIYAPGSKIDSITPHNYYSYVTKSGTSQASPFVAGAIASYVAAGVITSSGDYEQELYSRAQLNAVKNSNSTVSRLLRLSLGDVSAPVIELPTPSPSATPSASPTVVPVVPISAPLGDYSSLAVSVDKINAKSINVGWGSIKNANKYIVTVGVAGSNSYAYKTTSYGTNAKISGLASNSLYWVNVKAYRNSVQVAVSSQVEIHTSAGTASAPREATVKLDKLFWTAPIYDGGYKQITYKVQKLNGTTWNLIETTKNLYVRIVPAASGKSDSYRIIASTEYGDSLPSNVAVSIGSDTPQVTVAVPPLDSTLANSLKLEQLGAGSGFVSVSWSAVSGATSYKIQRSGYGISDWVDIASTSKNYRTITVKPGTTYVIRVVTNTGEVVGTAQYLGL